MGEVSASAVDPKCVGVICTKCIVFQERQKFFVVNYKGLEVLLESINDLYCLLFLVSMVQEKYQWFRFLHSTFLDTTSNYTHDTMDSQCMQAQKWRD